MSMNPVVFRRLLCAVFILAVLALLAARASAEGCPAEPVEEEGGTHRCYSAGKRGNVHLWTPAAYDAATAVTIVYVHGHNLGFENCANAHYLDCVWDAHGLASQFAVGGMNALFVAVEGPVNNRQRPKWTSLGDLHASLRRHGVKPPSKTAVIAHSAGIFTAMRFMGDARLAHLVPLDALYQDAPQRIARWFRASAGRRLTLVGADAVHARTLRLGRKLGCTDAGDPESSYPPPDRCAVAVDANLGHMDVVQGRQVIPQVLARMSAPKAARKRPRPAKKPRRE